MPVTEREDRLIRQSFERLRQDFDAHSTYFYERLFHHAPELRELFREDLAGQGMKFMSTLGRIIQHLHTPDELGRNLSNLGHVHASLGVRQADFAPMQEALIETLRNALQDDFKPELEKAWRAAYEDISRTMVARGDIP